MTIYNLKLKDALKKGVCVRCEKEAFPRCYSYEGTEEYKMSGLCEICYDEITHGQTATGSNPRKEDN